jgi:hypothetical protein
MSHGIGDMKDQQMPCVYLSLPAAFPVVVRESS